MKPAGLLVAALAIGTLSSAVAEPLKVDGGLVEGVTLPSGVRAWLGVPFAAPPVRELRWKPPQPVAPWSGVLHAERPAPMCLQALRSRTMNHYFGNEGISEDCLYLNVWAPAQGTKRPVLVWIYGGGFNVGSASMANYSGEGLARADVVRVNLSYRVGALGFLAHPELTREGSGANQGLADQIAGLQWVQRNIAAFGGDPDNVTLAGQSAGSTSVALLQASPAARGLFHRVVGMSGSPFADPMRPVALPAAEAEGLAVQAALGVKSLEEMRDLAGDRVLAVAANVPRTPIVVDGRLVAGPMAEVFADRRHSDVPVMLGFTRDESFRSLGPVDGVDALQAAVRREFPNAADAILKAYPASDAASARRAATDIGRDASLGVQMFAWASAQRRSGTAPAYAYFFTRRQPYAPGITFADHDPATAGAYHTGEVPYFLRTRDSLNLFRRTRDWEPADEQLEKRMSDALLAFVRTGRPTTPDLPPWPAFDPRRPQVMILGTEPRVADWPDFAALPLLESSAPTSTRRPATGTTPRD